MIVEEQIERMKSWPKDEPVFVLRAQDQLTPGLIWEWLDRFKNAHDLRSPENLQKIKPKIETKLKEAEACLLSIYDWQTKNGSKIPD